MLFQIEANVNRENVRIDDGDIESGAKKVWLEVATVKLSGCIGRVANAVRADTIIVNETNGYLREFSFEIVENPMGISSSPPLPPVDFERFMLGTDPRDFLVCSSLTIPNEAHAVQAINDLKVKI